MSFAVKMAAAKQLEATVWNHRLRLPMSGRLPIP
jgi:hypothetical protein